MLDLRVNLLKNRLYLTVDHRNRLEQSLPSLENAAKKLTPGFTCITRFVDTRAPDSADAARIEKLDRLLSDLGMAHVVHIGIACGMTPSVAAAPGGYTATAAATPEAAEKQLDSQEASATAGRADRCSN